MLIQNEVDDLVNVLTEERERYWMTPDMTKTGAAPGLWGSPSLADTLLRYHIYYICDAIWVHPLIWECCFAVLGWLLAMPNISPDHATTSILVGIASCTLSYWLSYSRPLRFVLCYTYGVPSDNHQFTVGLTVLYRLWHYKNVLTGIMVTP